MTDAREYMISDERKAALDNEAAVADAKAILTAAGYRILGPDEVDAVTVVFPIDDWHEDYGDVVWWTRLEGEWLGEAAWIGTPNDSDWPGYHNHWSPHPPFPRALGRKA